jgi:hypothetical protein
MMVGGRRDRSGEGWGVPACSFHAHAISVMKNEDAKMTGRGNCSGGRRNATQESQMSLYKRLGAVC